MNAGERGVALKFETKCNCSGGSYEARIAIEQTILDAGLYPVDIAIQNRLIRDDLPCSGCTSFVANFLAKDHTF